MKIIFTGDVSFSGIFLNSLKTKKPILDQKIVDIFANSDSVHINLENPITDQDFREKKGSSLRAPINAIDCLIAYNITICSLANNHIMDCGQSGLIDTISLLNNNDIKYYGIGPFRKYIIIKEDAISIALISSCSNDGPVWDGTNVAPFCFNLIEIKKIINDIKSNEHIDIIIYNYHGGTEFNLVPEPKRRKFLKILLDTGIDIIVSHHAHVPQGIEYINKKIIIYGLGNFIFDTPYQRNNFFTSESYFVQLIIKKNYINVQKYFYKMDLENGKVMLNTGYSELENYFNITKYIFEDDKIYRDAWVKECFRLYVGPLIRSGFFSKKKHFIKKVITELSTAIIKLNIQTFFYG